MQQAKDINHRPPRSWTKITLYIPSPATDIAADFLADLTDGAIEHNNSYFSEPIKQNVMNSLSAYLLEDSQSSQKMERVHLFLKELNEQYRNHQESKLETEVIVEEDWNSNWKKHFKPIQLTENLVIKPSWESFTTAKKNTKIIEIDPGMAFGTGMHASTQLAMQLIDDLFSAEQNPPQFVLDVGTGTGILGMGCSLLGSENVIGIDNDVDARVAARDNIDKNNLNSKITIIDQDLNDVENTFDLVIANIIHNTLIALAKPLVSRVKDNGFLIMAGILKGQQTDNIIQKFATLNMQLVKIRQQDEWCSVCLQKK